MSMSEVVRPGQVWISSTSHKKTRWLITKIENGWAWALTLDAAGKPLTKEESFGLINEDGTPQQWGSSWYVVEDRGSAPPIQRQEQSKGERSAEMEFFRATQPGYCVCNIPRDRCDYHHRS